MLLGMDAHRRAEHDCRPSTCLLRSSCRLSACATARINYVNVRTVEEKPDIQEKGTDTVNNFIVMYVTKGNWYPIPSSEVVEDDAPCTAIQFAGNPRTVGPRGIGLDRHQSIPLVQVLGELLDIHTRAFRLDASNSTRRPSIVLKAFLELRRTEYTQR